MCSSCGGCHIISLISSENVSLVTIIIAALVTQLPNLWHYRAGLMLLGIYDIYINPKWRSTDPIFKCNKTYKSWFLPYIITFNACKYLLCILREFFSVLVLKICPLFKRNKAVMKHYENEEILHGSLLDILSSKTIKKIAKHWQWQQILVHWFRIEDKSEGWECNSSFCCNLYQSGENTVKWA